MQNLIPQLQLRVCLYLDSDDLARLIQSWRAMYRLVLVVETTTPHVRAFYKQCEKIEWYDPEQSSKWRHNTESLFQKEGNFDWFLSDAARKQAKPKSNQATKQIPIQTFVSHRFVRWTLNYVYDNSEHVVLRAMLMCSLMDWLIARRQVMPRFPKRLGDILLSLMAGPLPGPIHEKLVRQCSKLSVDAAESTHVLTYLLDTLPHRSQQYLGVLTPPATLTSSSSSSTRQFFNLSWSYAESRCDRVPPLLLFSLIVQMHKMITAAKGQLECWVEPVGQALRFLRQGAEKSGVPTSGSGAIPALNAMLQIVVAPPDGFTRFYSMHTDDFWAVVQHAKLQPQLAEVLGKCMMDRWSSINHVLSSALQSHPNQMCECITYRDPWQKLLRQADRREVAQRLVTQVRDVAESAQNPDWLRATKPDKKDEPESAGKTGRKNSRNQDRSVAQAAPEPVDAKSSKLKKKKKQNAPPSSSDEEEDEAPASSGQRGGNDRPAQRARQAEQKNRTQTRDKRRNNKGMRG